MASNYDVFTPLYILNIVLISNRKKSRGEREGVKQPETCLNHEP
jgi:hypothetical protein